MEILPENINYFIEETRKISEYDFREYSIKSFTRRLEKIVKDNKMSLEGIVKKMSENNDFLEHIVKEITVNTTEPFRTPAVWKTLIPIMEEKLPKQGTINIWHAGCSTGQEVYSMLILLSEMGVLDRVKIYGTDLNGDVLEIAKYGNYKTHDFDDYQQNFDEVMGQFPNFVYKKYINVNRRKDLVKIDKFLVEKTVFVKHNLTSFDNIFGIDFDIIMCRNVLIYFDHNLQNKVLNFFCENLKPSTGILVIGKHESILGATKSKFIKNGSVYVVKDNDCIHDF